MGSYTATVGLISLPPRPTAADSIASARERIPIELAFLGERIFYKGYTTPEDQT